MGETPQACQTCNGRGLNPEQVTQLCVACQGSGLATEQTTQVQPAPTPNGFPLRVDTSATVATDHPEATAEAPKAEAAGYGFTEPTVDEPLAAVMLSPVEPPAVTPIEVLSAEPEHVAAPVFEPVAAPVEVQPVEVPAVVEVAAPVTAYQPPAQMDYVPDEPAMPYQPTADEILNAANTVDYRTIHDVLPPPTV